MSAQRIDKEPLAGTAVESVQEALARARHHARGAAAEATRAVRALLDAIALLQRGTPAESHPALSRAATWLDAIAAGIAQDGAQDAALTSALAEALDAEISRWEQRAQEDPDARAVLRAFLGVRELLWELGVRRGSASPARGAALARPRQRVQRVHVEGVPRARERDGGPRRQA